MKYFFIVLLALLLSPFTISAQVGSSFKFVLYGAESPYHPLVLYPSGLSKEPTWRSAYELHDKQEKYHIYCKLNPENPNRRPQFDSVLEAHPDRFGIDSTVNEVSGYGSREIMIIHETNNKVDNKPQPNRFKKPQIGNGDDLQNKVHWDTMWVRVLNLSDGYFCGLHIPFQSGIFSIDVEEISNKIRGGLLQRTEFRSNKNSEKLDLTPFAWKEMLLDHSHVSSNPKSTSGFDTLNFLSLPIYGGQRPTGLLKSTDPPIAQVSGVSYEQFYLERVLFGFHFQGRLETGNNIILSWNMQTDRLTATESRALFDILLVSCRVFTAQQPLPFIRGVTEFKNIHMRQWKTDLMTLTLTETYDHRVVVERRFN